MYASIEMKSITCPIELIAKEKESSLHVSVRSTEASAVAQVLFRGRANRAEIATMLAKSVEIAGESSTRLQSLLNSCN